MIPRIHPTLNAANRINTSKMFDKNFLCSLEMCMNERVRCDAIIFLRGGGRQHLSRASDCHLIFIHYTFGIITAKGR